MRRPRFIGIFNDVIGPVMRGPSSSHTAGSFHIASACRMLLGEAPTVAFFTFDRRGSYSETYRTQNADLAFAAGLLGWKLTDKRFPRALEFALAEGRRIEFKAGVLPKTDHPNMVRIVLSGVSGRHLCFLAKSTGGGSFAVVEIEGKPVWYEGKSSFRRNIRLSSGKTFSIEAGPIFYPQVGDPLFLNAEDLGVLARRRKISLGSIGRLNEARILGLSGEDMDREMTRRFRIMIDSVRAGLKPSSVRLKLLRPSAARILAAERKGILPLGGVPVRAAARALAVMHAANSGAVICAAPTGGSSGVLAGVAATLERDLSVSPDGILRALYAAGAVGLVFARRATFAAEIAGCQVEIGAAGAMAAAAVVEIAGGTARQACDAAAISLQNTNGSVCDLVAGLCEIPCHTRNAAAAASAFLCADLILGGYENPIPLDETIDASFASGRMLPPELRVTSRGGLAVTPSARALERKMKEKESRS
jgi:L-serine dehydratase